MISIDHIHSYLFFEDELIGSSIGSIKSMKAEVSQICNNYYSSRMDLLDSDMRSQSDIPPCSCPRETLMPRASHPYDAQTEFLQ